MQCLKIYLFFKVKCSGSTVQCDNAGLKYVQETQEDSVKVRKAQEGSPSAASLFMLVNRLLDGGILSKFEGYLFYIIYGGPTACSTLF